MSNGHKLSGSAAALGLLAFFMPWVLVSCTGQPLSTYSGYQLSSGVDDMEAKPILYLTLAASVFVLGTTAHALAGHTSERWHHVVNVAAALVGAASLVIQYSNMRLDLERAELAGIVIKPQIGFWLMVASLVFILVGGIWGYQEEGTNNRYDNRSGGRRVRPWSPPRRKGSGINR
jgi:hypothetical protein